MGHPNYEITEGTIELDGENILEWDATERARAGIFMAFQRPMSIPGVKMADFLRHATTNVRNPQRKEGEQLIPMREFRKELREKMSQLRMDEEFARRYPSTIPAEEVGLINAASPGTTLEAGRIVKRVVEGR